MANTKIYTNAPFFRAWKASRIWAFWAFFKQLSNRSLSSARILYCATGALLDASMSALLVEYDDNRNSDGG